MVAAKQRNGGIIMFKIFTMAVLVTLLTMGVALAAQYNVTMAWEYPDAPTDLAGYEVQVNDVVADTTIGPDQLTWNGVLELSDGDNTFAVRAFDEIGQRGEWSDSVGHNPTPGLPTLTVIVVQ
jgi:hypothetical protein